MCAALALVCVSSPSCTCVWVGIGVRVGGGETHLQVGSQRPFERELRLCTGDVSCVSRNLVRTTPTSNRRLVANGRPFRRPGRLQGRVPRRMDQIRSLVDSRRRSSPTAIRESGTSVRLGPRKGPSEAEHHPNALCRSAERPPKQAGFSAKEKTAY